MALRIHVTAVALAIVLTAPFGMSPAEALVGDARRAAATTSSGWVTITNACGIRASGRLYGWGLNDTGQIARRLAVLQHHPEGDRRPHGLGEGRHRWRACVRHRRRPGPVVLGRQHPGRRWHHPCRYRPTRIGAATNWRQASAGAAGCAIKGQGALWCWGFNRYVAVGGGIRTERHRPVRIGTRTDWKQVSAGSTGHGRLATGGGARGWGWNGHGEIGAGTRTHRSQPVTEVLS